MPLYKSQILKVKEEVDDASVNLRVFKLVWELAGEHNDIGIRVSKMRKKYTSLYLRLLCEERYISKLKIK